jgi:hypothetical protein
MHLYLICYPRPQGRPQFLVLIIARHPQFVRHVIRARTFNCHFLILSLSHTFHSRLYIMICGHLLVRVLLALNITSLCLMIFLAMFGFFLYVSSLMPLMCFVISIVMFLTSSTSPFKAFNVIMARNLIISSFAHS